VILPESRIDKKWLAINGVLALIVAIAWSFTARSQDDHWPTLLFLFATVAIALFGIHTTSTKLNDARLLRLGYLFIAALAVTLLVLGTRWKANLANGGPGLEGDQERFYFQAAEFARGGFRLSSMPSLNYTGVLFVYGVVFKIFGHNPYAPALLNALLTLFATLLLARVAYKIKRERSNTDWMIAFFVVPEVLLHIVMPSRDILAMTLLTISVLGVANYVLDAPAERRPLVAAMTMLPSLFLLALVRTPALIPAVASIILLLVMGRLWRSLLIVAIPAVAILVAAPLLSESLGGYHLSYAQVVSNVVVDPNEQPLDVYHWNQRSIGRLLIPHTRVEAFAYAVPRLILYWIAPLPSVHWRPVAAGDWTHDQILLTALSSIMYAVLFPLVIASLWISVVRSRDGLALQIPFWITIIAIVVGTPLIHERYRVMAIPLLAGCMWLGRMATRRELLWSYAIWGGVLLTGGAAALAYKEMPCAAPVIVKQPQVAAIRAGETVTLSVTAQGDGLSYQWFAGNRGFLGAPVLGGTQLRLDVKPEVSSTYWVRVTNACGQDDSAISIVIVK
jgi:hypothetical protein